MIAAIALPAAVVFFVVVSYVALYRKPTVITRQPKPEIRPRQRASEIQNKEVAARFLLANRQRTANNNFSDSFSAKGSADFTT